MFSTKIYIFLHKKIKVKKCLLLLFSFFSFFIFFLFFQRFSSVSCCVNQFLGGLHLFWEIFHRFYGEHSLVFEKIQVQIIVFNKKAVSKISRLSNSKSSPWNLVKFCIKFFLENVSRMVCWIFFSFDCELMVKLLKYLVFIFNSFLSAESAYDDL